MKGPTVAQLRDILRPYGVRYLLELTKAELTAKLREIQQNERDFGSPNRPVGNFRDGS